MGVTGRVEVWRGGVKVKTVLFDMINGGFNELIRIRQ